MKIFSLSAFILAAITFIAALVNQFYFVPIEKSLDLLSSNNIASGRAWSAAHHQVVVLGEIVLFIGIAALILNIIPAIKKKNKLAYVGAILSVIAIVFGLAQGTHMFS